MLRKFIFFLLAFASIKIADAQPPAYAFQAASGTYTPLSGGTPVALSYNGTTNNDDGIAAPAGIPIGFTFTYNGTAYTTIRPCANGFAAFGTTALATNADTWTNNLISGVAAQRPILAALWDDMDLSSGTVSYALSGTAPSRVLTIEWANAKWDYNASSAVMSFQIKLYETTNVIEYVYRQESGAISSAASGGASIGLSTTGTGSNTYLSLQDASASPAVSFTNENSTILTKPATGQIYRWIPYCTSAANNTTAGGEKISNVTFGAINNTSNSNTGYENFSAVSSFIIQGASTPITINVANPKPTDQAYVWIDFNHNGSFTDAGELVYTSAITAGPYTANIAIPALSSTVLPGLARMRVRVQDTNIPATNNTSCGNSEWGQVEDYTLDINACVAASFTTQPLNATTCVNGSATFSAAVNGSFLTYQWQVSADNGATWTNVSNNSIYSGVTTTTLSISGITTAMSGYLYRLVVNGICTTANLPSGSAKLSVNSPATVSVQPLAAKAVCVGGSQTFTVGTTNTSATYQWQVSTDGGVTWAAVSSATSATLSLTNVTMDMNGNRYRALVTVSPCSAVVSSVGILTVNPLPVVTLQTAPDSTVQPGLTTFVTAGSTPKAVSYAWTLNGIALSGATGSRINPNYNGIGTYQVTVTDVNGCQNTSNKVLVDAKADGRLFIFPNPNKGKFSVRFYGPKLVRSISIYNAAGARVYYKKYMPVTVYLADDLNLQLPTGYYVLQLELYYTHQEAVGSFVVQ